MVAKIFTFIGRATAGCVFAVLYIYTGELFPTGTFLWVSMMFLFIFILVVRSGGMGLCGSIARVGTMLAPQILRLSSLASWLPGGFICITTTLAGIIW